MTKTGIRHAYTCVSNAMPIFYALASDFQVNAAADLQTAASARDTARLCISLAERRGVDDRSADLLHTLAGWLNRAATMAESEDPSMRPWARERHSELHGMGLVLYFQTRD